MKLIEAMKQVKDLARKASDIRDKIALHAADYDIETAVYGDRQKEQVSEWLQSHADIAKEILRLRVAIQRTNIETQVTMDLGGKSVTKSIAEWIHRRRDLAGVERSAWKSLTDRGLSNGAIKQSSGEPRDVRVRRYYDPAERDRKVELFTAEPSLIDGRLEVANAVTDLIEK